MEIKFDISGNSNSLYILKLCLLYFDDITVGIPCDHKMNESELFPMIDEDLINQFYYLEKSGYIKKELTYFDYMFHPQIIKLLPPIIKTISDIANEIWDNYEDYEDWEILEKVCELPSAKSHTRFTFVTLLRYYIFTMYYNFINNRATISDLQIVNTAISKFYNRDSITPMLKNNIKINCASICLPNLSNATFDDIFELKYKANDELIQLKYYLNSMIDNINTEDINYFENVIVGKVNSAIENLKLKMKDIRINVVQNFLEDIRNPLSYAPLLTTIFNDIPMHLSALTSLGLISGGVGLEYVKQFNDLKKDNMFFLFKLRNM